MAVSFTQITNVISSAYATSYDFTARDFDADDVIYVAVVEQHNSYPSSVSSDNETFTRIHEYSGMGFAVYRAVVSADRTSETVNISYSSGTGKIDAVMLVAVGENATVSTNTDSGNGTNGSTPDFTYTGTLSTFDGAGSGTVMVAASEYMYDSDNFTAETNWTKGAESGSEDGIAILYTTTNDTSPSCTNNAGAYGGYSWFAFEVEGSSSADTLTADDIDSVSELSSPAIGQEHALNASNVESASNITSPSISQAHSLLSTSIESISELTSPVLGVIGEDDLLANNIESASELTSPAARQWLTTTFTVDYADLDADSPFYGDANYSSIVIGDKCYYDLITSPDNAVPSMSGDGVFTLAGDWDEDQTFDFAIFDTSDGTLGTIGTITAEYNTIYYTIGIALESNSPLNFISLKEKEIGLITEDSISQSLTEVKTKELGLNTENNSAVDIDKLKSKEIGLNTEENITLDISAATGVVLGVGLESDNALVLFKQKLKEISLADETDFALSINPVKVVQIGQVVEDDSSLQIDPKSNTLAELTTENDTALPIGKNKTYLLGQAVETDNSLNIVSLNAKTILIGQAIETDLSFNINLVKAKEVGLVVEYDKSWQLKNIADLYKDAIRFNVLIQRTMQQEAKIKRTLRNKVEL